MNVDALGDAVAMAAMGRGDPIDVRQMHDDAGGTCFLAGIEVDEPWNISFGKLDVNPLFEFADGAHGAIRLQQLGLGKWKWIAWHLVSSNFISR
jgi:hypothetical protein